MKRYILEKFGYRETAENFSGRIKRSISGLDVFPGGYKSTGFLYRGYCVYLKTDGSYLIFYIIDDRMKKVTVLRIMQEGMDWQLIFQRWIQHLTENRIEKQLVNHQLFFSSKASSLRIL